MKPNDKIIIIGGGMAGLSCGCYLQMNGYRTEILETNRDPGGLCVAWDRGPYVFDGCLHWLAGLQPPSIFHRIWTELGAIAGRKVINCTQFMRVERLNGQAISLPADLDQLALAFKQLAPEDGPRIDKLIRAARICAPLDPPAEPLELLSGPQKTRLLFKYLPMMPVIIRWKNLGIVKYLSGYRNEFLRDVLLAATGDPRMSALVLVMVLAIRCGQNAGYVVGGSRALSEAIARRYANLGGNLRYAVQAVSVLVTNGQATGVRCADGSALPAGTVVSCADGHTTIFKMLEGRFVNKRIVQAYQRLDVFPALMQASLGVDHAFDSPPDTLSLPLARPLLVDDFTRQDRLDITVFESDSGFCPPGKTIFIVRFTAHYDYWACLKRDHPAEYRKAKIRLLHQVVELLDQRFAGLAKHLECSDLATPSSFERWTGNWQGSFQGWLPTPRLLGRRFPRTLPGLKNFYMAGHWVEPGGGLPPAALSGRYAAQMICARDHKTFTTTTA